METRAYGRTSQTGVLESGWLATETSVSSFLVEWVSILESIFSLALVGLNQVYLRKLYKGRSIQANRSAPASGQGSAQFFAPSSRATLAAASLATGILKADAET